MIWPFGRAAIKVVSGVFDAEGFLRTGRKPAVGRPLAEIYCLSYLEDDLPLWSLVGQEKLSRVARWSDDYFQYWAEVLALEEAGRGFLVLPVAWIIVVFDEKGEPASCVEYRPVFEGGEVVDVGYAEAAWRLSPFGRG